MRLLRLVSVLWLTACLPTRIATSAPAPPLPSFFEVPPQVVPIAEPVAAIASHAAQHAMVLGLSMVDVRAPGGVLTVRAYRFDPSATELLALAGRPRRGSRMAIPMSMTVHRRLDITTVFGAGSATVSPMVTMCYRSGAPGQEQCDLEANNILDEAELQQFQAFVRGLELRRAPPSTTGGDVTKI